MFTVVQKATRTHACTQAQGTYIYTHILNLHLQRSFRVEFCEVFFTTFRAVIVRMNNIGIKYI